MGRQGESGRQGEPGQRGPVGSTGSTGPQGPTGPMAESAAPGTEDSSTGNVLQEPAIMRTALNEETWLWQDTLTGYKNEQKPHIYPLSYQSAGLCFV